MVDFAGTVKKHTNYEGVDLTTIKRLTVHVVDGSRVATPQRAPQRPVKKSPNGILRMVSRRHFEQVTNATRVRRVRAVSVALLSNVRGGPQRPMREEARDSFFVCGKRGSGASSVGAI